MYTDANTHSWPLPKPSECGLGLWVNHRFPWSQVSLQMWGPEQAASGNQSTEGTGWGSPPTRLSHLSPSHPTSWAWPGSSTLYLPRLEGHAELPKAQRRGEPGEIPPPQRPLPKACFPELGPRRLGSSPGLMIHPFGGLFTSPLGLKIQGPRHPAGAGFARDCTMPPV